MLDAKIQEEILELLRSLQKRLGLAILLITHDLSIARSFCNRVMVLDGGKIIEEGPSKQIMLSPKEKITHRLIASYPKLPPIT